MKILFPHGEVSDADFRRYCVEPAVELRQLVWEQLYMLDAEYRQYEEWLGYELLGEQTDNGIAQTIRGDVQQPAVAQDVRSSATTGPERLSTRELINQGENRTIEFKSSARWNLHNTLRETPTSSRAWPRSRRTSTSRSCRSGVGGRRLELGTSTSAGLPRP